MVVLLVSRGDLVLGSSHGSGLALSMFVGLHHFHLLGFRVWDARLTEGPFKKCIHVSRGILG